MDQTNNPKVAIIVPTKDRVDFVIRMLTFYYKEKSGHPVYIGDSSVEVNRVRLENYVQRMVNKGMNVSYYHLPHLNGPLAINFLIRQVRENFCVFCGDDDVHFPTALAKCANFLDANLNYRTVTGRALIYSLNNGSPIFGKDIAVSEYVSHELVQDNPIERLKLILEDYYVNLFSVHRTGEFLRSFEVVEELDDIGFTEILPVCLDAVRGKAKKLDVCLFLRQTHESRWILPSFIDWISKPAWAKSYLCFVNKLSRELNVDEVTITTLFKEYLLRNHERDSHYVSTKIFVRPIKIVKTFMPWLAKIIQNWKTQKRIDTFTFKVPNENKQEVDRFFTFLNSGY